MEGQIDLNANFTRLPQSPLKEFFVFSGGIMKKTVAVKIFDKRNGDELYDAYGPSRFGDRLVWEGIVHDSDGELQGRYILTGLNNSHELYEDFQALMLDLGELHQQALGKRLGQFLIVVVPAITFLLAIFLCAYLVVYRQDYSAWAAAFMFFCIVASACALYFGKFIAPTIPGQS